MTTNTENIETRAISASAKFIEKRGYEVLTTSNQGAAQIVALDEEGTLVFCSVQVSVETLGNDLATRAEMEKSAAMYLAEHADELEPNFCIRFDVIALHVFADDKALLRHHINAFGADLDCVA